MDSASLYVLIIMPFLLLAGLTLARRRPMTQRAAAVLADHPGAERTQIYLPFKSGWTGKRQEMETRIQEMNRAGWIYLLASEASPRRTLLSRGGGVTLHFIRDSQTAPTTSAPSLT